MKINEIFYNEQLVIEAGGVGRVIAGVNTTPDVGPNEIKKQAKKFGFKVNKDGQPPLIREEELDELVPYNIMQRADGTIVITDPLYNPRLHI